MAINDNVGDREKYKFKESTVTSGQVGVVVVNPDGSNVSGGGSGQTANSATVTGFANNLPMARYNASPTARTEGQFGNLQADANGNLNVNIATLLSFEDQGNAVGQVVDKPLSVPTYTPDLDTSAAAEKSSITKASAGNLYSFTATNSNAAVRYLQFFNSTTVPADATVPVLEFVVPANGSKDYAWRFGRQFTTGIVWCFSTTSQTKTIITAANDALVDVNYK